MSTTQDGRDPGELTARAFILELGRALHEAGAPAHRIEDAMSVLARRIGVEGQFFTAPTSIFASFGPPEEQRTAMMRVEPAGVNLGRLSRLDELIREVEEGRLGPEDAIVQLRAASAEPERYGPLLSVACFGLASAAVARFLGGGTREILAGAAIGLQTGLLAQVASRRPAAARVFEWLAALAASLAALIWA
ncbi:MAG: threonine/serine exporter family protein, partial [Candidatus Eiseniibacteriota bacterium]